MDGHTALAGHGQIGNDLYSPFDEAFYSALPQRHQDIEQAKSLLKAAGQAGLTVDLQSTNGATGMNEGAQVFAQQAQAAGVMFLHDKPRRLGLLAGNLGARFGCLFEIALGLVLGELFGHFR